MGRPIEFDKGVVGAAWEKLSEPLTAQRHQKNDDDEEYLVLRGYTEQAAASVISEKLDCCISTAILGRPEHVKGSSYQLKPCRLCERRLQLLYKLNKINVYNLGYKFHIEKPRKYTSVDGVTKYRRGMRRRTLLRRAERVAYEKDHKLLEVTNSNLTTNEN